MSEINFGAIDIGSNAVRILVKSVEKREDNTEYLVQKTLYRFPLRLGEDAFSGGEISKQNTKHLICLMKAFKQILKIYNVADFKACATAAMREAKNGKQLAEKIYEETGIKVDIIGGTEEARLIYDTHIERTLDQCKDYLYVDVGGGSTQLTMIHEGELIFSYSFDIGTVRLMNNKVSEQEREAFMTKLNELYTQYPGLILIGSGGNINKLYKLSRNKSHKEILPVNTLQSLHENLSPLSIEQRMKQFKLKKDRAEVIVYASEIFLDVAKITNSSQIIVPSISIGDGIIEKMYEEYKNKHALVN